MHDSSDLDLLREYAWQSSEAAFAELVRRHIALVYSAALRHVGTAGHAEEITQAVFIILARKAGGWRTGTILEGWLYETTRLTALSFLRGERRRQFREQKAYMQSTLHESTNDSTWNQLSPLLDQAMSRLGKEDRDAVVLRFFKDRDLREVAATMRVSEAAAQRRILRALEKLRRFFANRGVDSTTTVIAETISTHSVQAAPAALAKCVTAVAIAKGAAASNSTLTIIQGALKIMAWTKIKTAVVIAVGVALLLAGGAITVGVARKGTDDKSTAAEILQKVQASYDALTSYSDSGKTLLKNPGHSSTITFAVKFARPDRYIIQNTQSWVGQASHTATFWPAGGQGFMLLDQARYFRLAESENYDPLEGATGFSAASGLSAAGLFFHKNALESHWAGSIGKLTANTNVVRQSNERVAGVNCYVLKLPVPGFRVTLWIGQKDFLIHQRSVALMASGDPSDTVEYTETHTDIAVNKAFSQADMTPRIPDGVKLETEPIH